MKNGRVLTTKRKVLGIKVGRVWLAAKAGFFLIRLAYDIIQCMKIMRPKAYGEDPRAYSFTDNPTNWEKIRNFKPYEFDSPDLKGSGVDMDSDFMNMLQNARDIAKEIDPTVIFYINSGYRTPRHNRKVGGSINSSHMRYCAADISAITSREKYAIVFSLLRAGFTRIGVSDDFVHVDNDTAKPKRLMWTY